MSTVFLKLQQPTVRIACTAIAPDATDTLQVTFNRYSVSDARAKMKSFHDARIVDEVPHQDEVEAGQTHKDLLEINRKIEVKNEKLRKASERKVTSILFDEITDIEGLVDGDRKPVQYSALDADAKQLVFNTLADSNPYVLALIEGYQKALVNVGESRAKNS